MDDSLLPQSLLALCNNLGEREKVKKERLVQFVRASTENETNLAKAWNSLVKAASGDIQDSLATLFLVFPIQITDQPFPALFGKRDVKPDVENDRYADIAKHANALLKLLTMDSYRNLSADVPSNERTRPLGPRQIAAMRAALDQVAKEAQTANPFGKYLTSHALAKDSDRKTIVIQIAGLNRYLAKPRYAALATLADALVSPSPKLKAKEIQRAWERLQQKPGTNL